MARDDTLLLHTTNRKYYMAYLFVPFPVTLDDLEGHSHNAGLIKCNSTNIFATLSHRPTVTLQLHNFDLFRTYRTSSFCTVAWQLARFQLTQRIALSLCDSSASCLNRLPWSPYSPKYPMFCGWGHNWHQRSCCALHISSQSQMGNCLPVTYCANISLFIQHSFYELYSNWVTVYLLKLWHSPSYLLGFMLPAPMPPDEDGCHSVSYYWVLRSL